MKMKMSEDYMLMRPIFNDYFSESSDGNIADSDAEVMLTHFKLELSNNHFTINGIPVPFIVLPCTKRNGISIVYVLENGEDAWLAYRSYATCYEDALIRGKSEIVKCKHIGKESLAAMQDLFDDACQFTW